MSNKLAKFAWITLFYNVIVVVWGVFLRASKSGDGCGKYWLTCHGEVIPTAVELKTVIEFSHRVMSGIDFFVVLGLLIAVLVYQKKYSQQKWFAILSFFFIVTEALIGAGLVLTGNVAEAITETRPYWAVGHLINTFLLLTFLTLLAWSLSTGKSIDLSKDSKFRTYGAAIFAGMIFVGITGAIAALSNMLYPSETIAEGVAKDFSAESPWIVRLRVFHPLGSVLVSVGIVFVCGWLKKRYEGNDKINKYASAVGLLTIIQVAFGALTLLSGAPMLTQLGHLLLADAIWILWVLTCAETLSRSAYED